MFCLWQVIKEPEVDTAIGLAARDAQTGAEQPGPSQQTGQSRHSTTTTTSCHLGQKFKFLGNLLSASGGGIDHTQGDTLSPAALRDMEKNAAIALVNMYVNHNQLQLSVDTGEDSKQPLKYWQGQEAGKFSRLAEIALDILSFPASQAFIERIFSLTTLLTSGRRNRMHKSLEMRVFLKLNRRMMAFEPQL